MAEDSLDEGDHQFVLPAWEPVLLGMFLDLDIEEVNLEGISLFEIEQHRGLVRAGF